MTILLVGSFPKEFINFNSDKSITILSAKNTIDAIKILKNEVTIKAIISHYNLEDNRGLDFFKSLREDSGSRYIPMILLSDNYDKNLLIEAFDIGVNDYFVFSKNNYNQILSRAITLIKLDNKNVPKEIKKEKNNSFKTPISKRIFDVIFAFIALVLLSPILILVLLAIKIESKGKVYYISKRVGQNVFDFYKLRSMKSGSDAKLKDLAKIKNQYSSEKLDTTINFNSPCPNCIKLSKNCSPLLHKGTFEICDYWYNLQKNNIHNNTAKFIKINNDPRVTKIGKFIRNTSIDELPQLINVLKGDMSIVGNRPLPLYEAELLTKDNHSKRFLAPAGITGLWQIELRGKGGIMSEEERIQLDNKYANIFIENKYNFWCDIKIILKTIPALLQKSAV